MMLETTKERKRLLEDRLEFYKTHLYEYILPFWVKNGIDHEYGGYFTCFNNYGDQLVSTDKYVWSQGRMLWLLGELAEGEGPDSKYLPLARSGYAFLKDHCRLPNGHCAFILTREGEPKEPVPGGGYDISTYADCFAVLGFAKFAEVERNQEALELALEIFDSIVSRFERREFRTEPEPLPPGYRAHGISMILLNTSHQLLKAAKILDHQAADRIAQKRQFFAQDIVDNFIGPDGIIRELIHENGRDDDCILGRYVNPGHTLEDMWFLLHYAVELEGPMRDELIDLVAKVMEATFQLGWDEEYGGLFHFVDAEGGKPRGELETFADHPLTQKVLDGWADKLWWVHSETVYATLLAYALTGKEELFKVYEQVHDYTFATFPHPDPSIGEWIQIRDRAGNPMDKVVALPVKDPFHITRALLLTIELLEEMLQQQGLDEDGK